MSGAQAPTGATSPAAQGQASQPGSFARRRIDVTFVRKTGTFTNGKNTLTLTGHRVSARIAQQGGEVQGALNLSIYGIRQDVMNDLTFVPGVPLLLAQGATVTVLAGADGTTLSTVFQGGITGAIADYRGSPDVPFMVSGVTAFDAALLPVIPSSYQGAADVAVILGDLASLAGLQFDNAGVTGVFLSNPYFPGTARSQIDACAKAAGIEYIIDGTTLAIWPRGGSRGGKAVLVSPKTGLVGYPTRTPWAVEFTMLHNPAIRFGAQVQLDTSVANAKGTWKVIGLQHALDADVPGGQWFTQVTALPLGGIF